MADLLVWWRTPAGGAARRSRRPAPRGGRRFPAGSAGDWPAQRAPVQPRRRPLPGHGAPRRRRRGHAVVTVVVPPLREIRLSSPLGPLFTPAGGAEPDPLTLVPVWPGDPVNLTERVEWVRQEGGWHGELGRTYPDARFHAHYRVELSFPLPCCWSPAAACCSRATSRCSRCCGHWDTHSGIKEALPGRSGVGCSRPFGPG